MRKIYFNSFAVVVVVAAVMSNQTIVLSIITVSFNEEPHILRLHTSFDRLQRPDNVTIESILIDGGSSDQTVEQAKQAGFTKIVIEEGASIPVCRNKGLEAAEGQWIAFVDADCELAEDWLMQALPFLESSDPVVIGWPVIPPKPGTWVQESWHVHWLNKNRSFDEWQGHPVISHEAFRLITTRNMILHREVTEQIGEFDENLTTGEDTDFVFRAYMKNIRVMAVPALHVLHHGEPSNIKEFFQQQLWHANRKSYSKIMEESGAKTGGNAPKFTWLFLAGSLLGLTGSVLAVVLKNGLLATAWLPLILLISLPAAWISSKARRPLQFFPLFALYAIYGFARSLDLLGLNRTKLSWKS